MTMTMACLTEAHIIIFCVVAAKMSIILIIIKNVKFKLQLYHLFTQIALKKHEKKEQFLRLSVDCSSIVQNYCSEGVAPTLVDLM
jgi:hypothetical protein